MFENTTQDLKLPGTVPENAVSSAGCWVLEKDISCFCRWLCSREFLMENTMSDLGTRRLLVTYTQVTTIVSCIYHWSWGRGAVVTFFKRKIEVQIVSLNVEKLLARQLSGKHTTHFKPIYSVCLLDWVWAERAEIPAGRRNSFKKDFPH